VEALAALKALPGIRNLPDDKWGLLTEKAAGLWQAGLRRLNISLDTLGQALRVPGDHLSQVWQGIRTARLQGFLH
jgi:molybdenum cofactor biosynthesis enzyme MoaA